ncbi:uncharacterized protein LOC111694246 [Trichogramma pretiosum]|uniref:uncharacterized protein LOC111694246 n=1 Tax=Trichogramma pretiosum TaxID=7493 RepID=UPI000C71A11E|nr:uncharacterized protein LOC111694246 [Trichogramma pretiosum]
MYIMYYLKYGLILLDSWPGVDSAKLCNALVALSCASLCFQFWDAAAVFHDLDALLTNMETSIGVLSSVFKIVTFRMQSASTKKMVKMSIEEHVEKNAANPNSKTGKSKSNNENAVKLILQILFVSYFVLGLSYPAVSLVSYALGSSEERVFVLPSMYFIPSPRESPAFELLWIYQFVVVLFSVLGQCIADSSLIILNLSIENDLRECSFYNFQEKEQNLVRYMLVRAQNSNTLEIGKFGNLSLFSLTMVKLDYFNA